MDCALAEVELPNWVEVVTVLVVGILTQAAGTSELCFLINYSLFIITGVYSHIHINVYNFVYSSVQVCVGTPSCVDRSCVRRTWSLSREVIQHACDVHYIH